MIPCVFRIQPRTEIDLDISNFFDSEARCTSLSKTGIRLKIANKKKVDETFKLLDVEFRVAWENGSEIGCEAVSFNADLFQLFSREFGDLGINKSDVTELDFDTIKEAHDQKENTPPPYKRLESISGVSFYTSSTPDGDVILATSGEPEEASDSYMAKNKISCLKKGDDGEWYKVWPLSLNEDIRVHHREKTNKVLGEIIGHVRSARRCFDSFTLDHKAREDWLFIGQRYNGIYGTAWNFSKGRPAYQLLAYLSEVIDGIIRTYTLDETRQTVSETHVKIVGKALNLSEGIIIELRAGVTDFTPAHQQFREIKKAFKRLDDIDRRKKIDQENVDQLIDLIS